MELQKIIKISLIIFSGFITVLFLEFILTKTGYQKRPYWWVWVLDTNKNSAFNLDQQKIFAFKKNYKNSFDIYDTDEEGFRYIPKQNISNYKTKIIILGDSVVWGHNVNFDESYPYLFEKNLSQHKISLVVQNAGVPGYGIEQEYSYLINDLIPNKPNMIIWNLNVNDFDLKNNACLFSDNEKLVPISARFNLLFEKGWLMRNTPRFIGNSNLLNLFITSTNDTVRDISFTIGCKQNESDKENKLFLIAKRATEIANNNNVKLIFALVPHQQYFDTKFPNIDLDYYKLINTLEKTKLPFIDFNNEIAKSVDEEIIKFRNGQSYTIKTNKLGVKTDELVTHIFLNDNQDRNDYGWKHPNQLGYQLMANILTQKLIDMKLF